MLRAACSPYCRFVGYRFARPAHFQRRFSAAHEEMQGYLNHHQEHIESVMAKFRVQLQAPDYVQVRERDAQKQFGLTEQDLKGLPFTEKENPYESAEKFVKQYGLHDVIQASLTKYHHKSIIEARYRRYLENESWRKHVQTVYGMDDVVDAVVVKKNFFWRRLREGRKAIIGGLPSVQQGLISNSAIAGIKGIVFLFTGSNAILADFMHSCADVGNYSYRYITLVRSSGQEGDLRHPYGYDRLRSICADRSFFILLCLGGVVPMYAGIQSLFENEVFSQGIGLWLSVSMFAVSGGLESLTLRASYMEARALAAKEQMSFFRYLREGTDLMPVSTFLESFCGVFGAFVGTTGVVLAAYTNSMLPDNLAAIIMSGTVAAVSCGLLARSSTSLLGQTLPLSLVLEITMMLENDPVVVGVYDVKTEVLGVETARFKAEIEFNADAITRKRLGDKWSAVSASMRKSLDTNSDAEVEDWVSKNDSLFLLALTSEIKRLESQIKDKLTQFKSVHVDLEPW